MIDLRPCPFCGKVAGMFTTQYMARPYVMCQGMHVMFLHDAGARDKATEEELAEIWNDRWDHTESITL